jgi:DNA-binding CsgD family transcriptional regulator
MNGPIKQPPGARINEFALAGQQFLVLSFPQRESAGVDDLTGAELAVARLALQGLSTRQIAIAREASPRTINNQLAAIYRKLGVGSRVQLAVRWWR